MKFKLKYQDGLTKKLCMSLAGVEREKFSKAMWAGKIDILPRKEHPEFDIISYSSKNDFEEQVLSLLSFLHYVGTPQRWIIYSDGTHSEVHKEFLNKNFPFVELKVWHLKKELTENILLQDYLKVCHLSKKLHAILGHDYVRQTIYVDSDILFYSNASVYFNSKLLIQGLWYLPELNWGSFKTKGINFLDNMFALNSGLLILNQTFQQQDVFEYLKSLNSGYEYFSEQNSFNYSFKKQQAALLDPRQFVIGTDDQFEMGMQFQPSDIAMRHYVTPVRHKMWQKGWRWHFNN